MHFSIVFLGLRTVYNMYILLEKLIPIVNTYYTLKKEIKKQSMFSPKLLHIEESENLQE